MVTPCGFESHLSHHEIGAAAKIEFCNSPFLLEKLGTVTKRNIISYSNQAELYFEESDIEQFVERLEMLYPDTEYVNRLVIHSWGQKAVRFYDPDGNLIEVGAPV